MLRRELDRRYRNVDSRNVNGMYGSVVGEGKMVFNF